MTLFRTILAAARWLERSWVGDLLGAVSLFVTGYLLIFFAGVLQ